MRNSLDFYCMGSSYGEELLFQMSCYIIKQERKEEKKKQAAFLAQTLQSAQPASLLHQIPTARPIHGS